MSPMDRPTIPTQVMARQVGDETVILDLASGTYFGLNPVGARMWQLIGEGRTFAQICETLSAEYEVDPQELQRDIERLLAELQTHGLVTTASA